MTTRKILSLALIACSSLTLLTAVGCENSSNIAGPELGQEKLRSVKPIGVESEYDLRVEEIRSLAETGDVEAAAEATNSLFADLSRDAESGAVGQAEVEDVATATQNAVQDIDIDISFGTNKKCDAQFNCVADEQMCLIVIWRVDEVGGGKNCFNF